MTTRHAWIPLIAALTLALHPLGALAQDVPNPQGLLTSIQPVHTGSSFSLTITVAAAAVSSSSATLLALAKQIKTIYQGALSLPVTQVQFITPDTRAVLATFSGSELN